MKCKIVVFKLWTKVTVKREIQLAMQHLKLNFSTDISPCVISTLTFTGLLTSKLHPVADPEVLTRGGELRGDKEGGVWGEGCAPPQNFFLEF